VTATDTQWRIGFAAPGVFAVINMAMWVTLMKDESLFNLIR